jgi:hypothetical protein
MPSTVDPTITPPAATEPAAASAAEAELVISALEAAAGSAGDVPGHDERRRHKRVAYRVTAELRLFSDAPDAAPWRLFTRDASARGVGFVTRDRLPLGYGGVVTLAGPAGQALEANCTLFRCRDIGNGWFEGALYFNREQWAFAAEADELVT